MQSIGQFLEGIGPAFATVMFFLVVLAAVTLVLMSVLRLAHRERPAS